MLPEKIMVGSTAKTFGAAAGAMAAEAAGAAEDLAAEAVAGTSPSCVPAIAVLPCWGDDESPFEDDSFGIISAFRFLAASIISSVTGITDHKEK